MIIPLLLGTRQGPFDYRFERSYVPEPMSGCWLLVGTLINDAYGAIRDASGKTVTAHRASWRKHHGQIPDDMQVLHRCDTTCCVNPDHLFLGTHLDNMIDKAMKGRASRLFGEKNPAWKDGRYAVR